MATAAPTRAHELVSRVFSVIDGHHWDDVETVVHPEVAVTVPFGEFQTAAEWTALLRQFADAMPDGAHHLSDLIDGGDRIAAWGTWTGTHTGPLATPGGPVPATGRRVEQPFCVLVSVGEDGRLTRVRVYLDRLAMLVQLGLAPAA